MDPKFVIAGLIIVVIILMYVLYQYSNASTIVSYTTLNQSQTDVSISTSPASLRYAIGVWIYVNSWQSGTQKPICNIPNIMNLSLDANSPTLYFYNLIGSGNISPTSINISDNFPLQKWTYVTVSADSNYVDFYIDGKMVKSTYLNNNGNALPTPPTQNVVQIGKTSTGSSMSNDIMISRLYRWPNALAPQDVWSEYLKGNGVGYWSSISYGLNLQLMKNNANAYNLKVF